MSDASVYEEPLVFGLDIGTRNVVGTVGYRNEDEFIVVAQYVMEHETRAMLDGQIHDIGRVGRTIAKVKAELERQIEQPLTEVCIAAAGRVLKTVTTTITFDYEEETVVTGEDIHTLDLLGIEKAQDILQEMNDTKYKFYCVGYSVVKYFLNDEPFSNLESHKAERIGEDVIVTFLPEDVVDGLYAAVEKAGLSVANMTLEPIAAINVAIPENFRLLNIALVDIGAGTSDISVTRDGSIIAYGMIPLAGDEVTELIVQNYLVDFKTAEYIKLASGIGEEVTYRDIMLIEHTIKSEEVWKLTEPVVDRMTTEVAAKIMELNGDRSVSATFVVGGGGKIHGYTEMLAEKLGLPLERVALRGEEVLQEVTFLQQEIKKDPLLVTPIGICLNYYDQRNSFIMVRFNGERIKLYDNNHLTIVDAALQAGFPNEELFPKRGRELQFMVNGASRIVRGEAGESAEVYMNSRLVNINTKLEPNCDIVIEPSTKGAPASCTLEQLDEYTSADVAFVVNGRLVRCPKFLEVNGSLELPSYQIQEGDRIETRSFYTVGQLAEFMDVEVDMDHDILVNNRVADFDTLIYENFSLDWTILSYGAAAVEPKEPPALTAKENGAAENAGTTAKEPEEAKSPAKEAEPPEEAKTPEEAKEPEEAKSPAKEAEPPEEAKAPEEAEIPKEEAKAPEEAEIPKEEAKVPEETEIPKEEAKAPEETEIPKEETGAPERTESPKEAEASKETEAPKEAEASKEAEAPKKTEELKQAEQPKNTEKPASEMSIRERRLAARRAGISVLVYVNEEPVRLTGKTDYIFVDVFNFYDFDLKASNGRAVVTLLNGRPASFSETLKAGDRIEIGWQER